MSAWVGLRADEMGLMVVYRCQNCKRPLEVDDGLAGKQVACPHCGQITDVPAVSQVMMDVPIARPASVIPGTFDASPGAASSGPLAGTGPEGTVLRVHPAVFRARPLATCIAFLLVVGGGVGLYTGWARVVPWLEYVSAGAMALALAWWLVRWTRTRGVVLTITNKRTTLRRGVLGRDTKEIMHSKVQDVEVSQRFPQRLLGIGGIRVADAGGPTEAIEVDDVPDPAGLRRLIDSYRPNG